ncbi:MAG: hypothetical protein SVV03_05680 [Candidatus Nanohaloarchaea archaeon]|nr:hypothetical protein [Candidatus Nanohaloarchaea archaeon]
MTLNLLLSLAGLALSVLVLVYSYRAIQNFKNSGDVTIALNIPHGAIQRGIKIMLTGFLVLVASMVTGRIGKVLGLAFFETVSRIGVLLALLSIVLFLRSVALSIKR